MYFYQITIFCIAVAAASADNIPWPGPFADHVNGQLVHDTPEVAAAKIHLAEAHAQARAILPELPLEEKFPTGHVHHVPQVVVPQNVVPHFPHSVPVLTTPRVPLIPAEAIPRSPIGETPEVHAARQAHLRALSEIAALLPKLPVEVSSTVIPHIVPQPKFVFDGNVGVVDTPEVAAARAAHARAFAEALQG